MRTFFQNRPFYAISFILLNDLIDDPVRGRRTGTDTTELFIFKPLFLKLFFIFYVIAIWTMCFLDILNSSFVFEEFFPPIMIIISASFDNSLAAS